MLKNIFNLKLPGILVLASALSLSAQTFVASYPLDGNANDASGNGNNGTVTNGTYVPDRFGTASKSLLLTGTSSGIDFVSDLGFPSGQSNATISLWFKSTVTGSRLINNGFNGNEAGFMIDFQSGGIVSFGMGDMTLTEGSNFSTAAFVQASVTGLNDGNWHNVIVVVDNTNKLINIRVDGIKQDLIKLLSSGGTIVGKDLDYSTLSNVRINGNNHIPFTVGKLVDNLFHYTVAYFKGSIDDIRIYSDVLTECQLKELYQAGSSAPSQPVIATTPGTSLCKNTLYTFGVTSVAGQTYTWKTANGTPSTQNGNIATFKWTNSGIDVITITAFNSCSSTTGTSLYYPVTITNSSGLILTVTGPNSLCISTTGFYTAGPTTGDNYEWTLISGATSTVGVGLTGYVAAFQFLTSGVNYIKVRAHNSCGWGDYTIYPVTVNGVINNFSISGLSTVCPTGNSDYTITGITPSSAADAFLWVVDAGISHVDLNSICTNDRLYFPDNQGASYNISVVGINACGLGALKVKTVTVASGGVKPVLSCVGAGCAQLSVNTPGAGISICWSVNGGSCTFSGQTLINRTHDVQTRVTFTNTTTGCSYSAYYFPGCNDGAARIEESSMTFAQNANTEAFKLYPNPNEGNFTFETDGSKGEAFIINILGQVIDRIELVENQYAYSLNVTAKSTYVLRIRTSSANKNIKFTIK